ncbi:hypothetical protein SLEP1_g17036 [Rubroshorea leprosula]|uniref:Reverse transcriptase n=1 Tax=Rubroshorea leprosula TaxID=152421 RepID=A0AAV5J3D5_9ROSI|nr:hypothetical protein SLEP1_g17036 [Rubroshorea leprosula]
MVHTRSVRAGNSSLPLGQSQPPNNLPPLIPPQLPPQPPPQVPAMFPPVDHAEGGDENQPHNSAHNSASTANQDVVAAQLAAMQQQFGVFQLVLAQLLARNNAGDPLINLLNPTPQPPTPQQNPEPVQHAPAVSESQGQSHIAPVQQPLHDDVTRRLDSWDGESLKNFMSRFNDAVLEVSSFDQAVGITAVISGLSHERFRDSLLKHLATTFSEVNDRSLKFISAEEYALSLKFELESLAQKGMLNEYVQRVEQPRFVREQRPQPQEVRNPPNRQSVGYQQAPPPLPPPVRILHMITGGLEAGGLSSKQRKQYVREVKHQNRAQKRKFDDADWKSQLVTFTSVDFDTVVTPHNDPLVTSVMINNCEVQRVLVDTGSAPDIMYFHCFESLGLDPALLQKYDGPIHGFNNQSVLVEGVLTMNVAFGSGRTYVTPSVWFLVVKMASSFNVVIGRPMLTEIRAVVSQSHLCMKFPTPMGIATLRVEDVEEVHIDDRDPSRKTQIGTKLNLEEKAELIAFPRANKDVFAWTSVDMPGIPTSVIKEKVEKLLQACFVRRVDYCEWIANPVLVKKANSKWRMCIDYTNLNDACPKDCYPMPNIDKLVEAASGNERLSLLDAYSGYHQVPMAPEDADKTSFYAGDEIYCYVMMPFGLKNAGATYQKMVTIVFRAQIGRNLEVYVDDIVVKSLKAGDHLIDLKETFNNLRKNRMRLNRANCIFGVESGKFLGFIVSRRGIEVNPEKIKVVAEMEPPNSMKDVQRLMGRVAALRRFISKSVDKCLPFFKIMRLAAQKDEFVKQKKFAWNSECQAAFDELKSYLSSPPLLTKADDGEILYLYLGISDEAISSVLVREEGKQQKPVYYISSVLHGAEVRYSIAEKVALAVVTSARKLRPYFQSHPIIVLTDQPLRQIPQKPECSGRLIKWAVELGEFEITFQQRSAIRAQALADFIVECTPGHSTPNPEPNDWTLYVDGASSTRVSSRDKWYQSQLKATSEPGSELHQRAVGSLLQTWFERGSSVVRAVARDVVRAWHETRSKRGVNVRRSRAVSPASKDVMTAFEGRLAKMELAMGDVREQLDTLDSRMEEQEERCGDVEDLRGKLQGALNSFMADINKAMDEVRGTIAAEASALKAELNEVKGDLALCKAAMAAGVAVGGAASVGPKLKVPEPPKYGGKRDAKELDNFLWMVERYFDAMNVGDEAAKIHMATMYFEHDATLWWRRRHSEMQRGICNINTWEAFKGEFRKQFYPENAEEVAMKRLRVLKHRGTITEYIREYNSLMLEIPDMPERSRLLYFMDGLQQWAEQELKRRGVQDLASAIAAAESLIEFSKEPPRKARSKYRGRDKEGSESEHEEDAPQKPSKPLKGKGKADDGTGERSNGGKEQPKAKRDCYLCGGPHWARECPQRNKLNAIISALGEEPQAKELRLGAMTVFNSILAQKASGGDAKANGAVEMSLGKTYKYIAVEIKGESIPALLDSGADQSLIAVSSGEKLGLPCTKERGWVKVVDQPSQPIHGVARGVPVQIGSWSGEIDLHVVPMKDFKMVLGRDFISRMLPFTFTRDGRILFEDRGVRYEVPLERLPTEQTVLAAMEVSGGSEREHGQTVESKSGKARGTAHSAHDLQRKRGGHAAQTCGNSQRGSRHSTRAALTRASRALVGESVTEREFEGPSQGHRALELKISAIQVYSDSQLVVNQTNSIYEVVDPVMADSLSKFASDSSSSSRSVFVEVLDKPIFVKPRIMEISTNLDTPSWTDSIISFLRDGIVPEDMQEAMKLRKKASRYTLVNGVLYKRSLSLPLLRCLNPYEAEYALREVHEGVCGSHVGARTLAHKVLRYGIPNQIVVDNGTQLNCTSFQDFCSSYRIKLQFTSVYHPESNGMVESVNKCILEGIKPRLEPHKAKWADELNNVLWAYRTTSRTTTGETPYHLAFGTEVVIPVEIGVPSFWVTHFDERRNGQLLRENLDLLAEAGLTRFETRFGKLAPNWEGPYIVAEVPYPGAYILQDAEGRRVPRV